MEEVAIVIPVYKPVMSKYELISFNQCNKILSSYKKIIIAPEGLDTSSYQKIAHKVVTFDKSYFESLKHYNKLLLSETFYKEFTDFEYILIYQLDAFVFEDLLHFWCQKKYDYIGAAWINDYFRILINIILKINLKTAIWLLFKKNFWNCVGNGGLSLRRIPSFLAHFNDKSCFADKWTANEDYYWIFFAKNNNRLFSVPKPKEAMKFSIELAPKYCLKKNKYKLPFGLHAWERYNINVWRPYFKDAGYEI
jgi:hypothetical protein